MPSTPAGWALLLVVILFFAFLLFKAGMNPLPGRRATPGAREKVREAKREAHRAKGKPLDKARAWRRAAELALSELQRPSLAANYALRALRAHPDDVAAIGLLVDSLTQVRRFRTLERMLWRRLKGDPGPGYDRAYDALLALYEGPLRRRERALALRAMRERSSQPS
ncbi:MAG: hypothetical protein AAGF12_17865 [Myxococcota bacterium]